MASEVKIFKTVTDHSLERRKQMPTTTIQVNSDGTLTPISTPGWLDWDGQCEFVVKAKGTYNLKFTAPENLTFDNFRWITQGGLTYTSTADSTFVITDPVVSKDSPGGVFLVDLSDGTVVDPSVANLPPE
jgi:hypothetical protein